MSDREPEAPEKCLFDWDERRLRLQCQVHREHRIHTYVDRAGEFSVLYGLWLHNQLTGAALKEIEG